MLYEVILRQAYFARAVLNRWHYNSSGTPATVTGSFALTSAFGGIPAPVTLEFPVGSIMARLANIQVAALSYVELQVQALYDVTDFYSVPYSPAQVALQTGTPMSPFAAYPLQSNRVRTDVRRGNKRFCGVSESFVGDAGVITGDLVTNLTGLADEMSEILEYDDEGNTLSFNPCVLSLEKHDPDEDHEDFWYALYPTLAEQLDHAALGVNWTPKAFITTQNSRKD